MREGIVGDGDGVRESVRNGRTCWGLPGGDVEDARGLASTRCLAGPAARWTLEGDADAHPGGGGVSDLEAARGLASTKCLAGPAARWTLEGDAEAHPGVGGVSDLEAAGLVNWSVDGDGERDLLTGVQTCSCDRDGCFPSGNTTIEAEDCNARAGGDLCCQEVDLVRALSGAHASAGT